MVKNREVGKPSKSKAIRSKGKLSDKKNRMVSKKKAKSIKNSSSSDSS